MNHLTNPSGTSRFNPDNSALRESLAWHARITAELQTRVRVAQKYLSTSRSDPMLAAILAGDERSIALWTGVDTRPRRSGEPLYDLATATWDKSCPCIEAMQTDPDCEWHGRIARGREPSVPESE